MMNSKKESRRVVAIGLDSAEIKLIRNWVDAGELPNLATVLREGAVGELTSGKGYTAETPWTIALTGCWPQTSGFWSPARYHRDYRVVRQESYDYADVGRFYDYCRDRKVIVFDVPHARRSDRVNGIQVLGWGAHSPQGPSETVPPDLMAELNEKYGEHPTLHRDDFLVFQSSDEARKLQSDLIVGIERRTSAVVDMMRNEEWDLMFVAFGEPHSAGHGFWHYSESDNPLHEVYAENDFNPLLAVYKAMDHAVGVIREAMPDDGYLMVFSQEGMKANSSDLPSWLFLPELLFRYSFEGRAAIAAGRADKAPPPLKRQAHDNWMHQVWGLRNDVGAIQRLVSKFAPLRASYYFDRLLNGSDRLQHPLACERYSHMPQMWYQPFWPRMKAFGLPSFSEGNVRINLRGREAEGRVEVADYDRVREEISELIRGLVDARTGEPICREIIYTRDDPMADDANLPDADIMVLWQPWPADTVDSDRFGRIGPAPFRRTGDHYNQGFFALCGREISPRTLPPADLVDLAPTLLDLMNVRRPNHFDGRSRVAELV